MATCQRWQRWRNRPHHHKAHGWHPWGRCGVQKEGRLPFRGTLTGCSNLEVQQGQMPNPAPGIDSGQTGDYQAGELLCWKGLGRQHAEHEPTSCPGSKNGRQHPQLSEKTGSKEGIITAHSAVIIPQRKLHPLSAPYPCPRLKTDPAKLLGSLGGGYQDSWTWNTCPGKGGWGKGVVQSGEEGATGDRTAVSTWGGYWERQRQTLLWDSRRSDKGPKLIQGWF